MYKCDMSEYGLQTKEKQVSNTFVVFRVHSATPAPYSLTALEVYLKANFGKGSDQ